MHMRASSLGSGAKEVDKESHQARMRAAWKEKKARFNVMRALLLEDFKGEDQSHLNPLLQHSGQSSLVDLVCQILDLAPENRKVG